MGKAAIFMVVAAMLSGGALLFQADRTEVETDTRQAQRQGQVLAREIARSGQNAVLAKARKLQRQNPTLELEQIVDLVNGDSGRVSGVYQGGNYEARIYLTSSSSFAVEAIGSYLINEHEIRTERVDEDILGEEILEVEDSSNVVVEVVESTGGYCSAIYLQRWVPKNNNGHGNNVDWCDISNPGKKDCLEYDDGIDDEIKTGKAKGKGAYFALVPELLLPPGTNRDGMVVQSSITMQGGMRLNFILAVDADFNCEEEGNTTIEITDKFFEYTRDALDVGVSDLTELQEAPYAMIQQKPGSPNTWRIAFEDLYFRKDKLEDVKQNGYGGAWDNKNKTYGGTGWIETDSDGYWKLYNYSDKPDFSDQVIEVTLVVPPGGGGETD